MKLEQAITDALRAACSPSHLEVVNESNSHNVPANSETHFKVVMAAAMFRGKSLVSRHRAVYDLLAFALAGGVHALALHTYTPEEWASRAAAAPTSPKCLGGGE
jgi:BolA family transcriptional regulator, general stress-responsive regulator